MKSMFRALAIRNYRLYASGGVVSNVGTWVQRVAQDWLVLVLHGGDQAQASVALGITTGLQFLPVLLLSPYAGVIADRMSKRTLLQYTQVWMAVWSAALAILASPVRPSRGWSTWSPSDSASARPSMPPPVRRS